MGDLKVQVRKYDIWKKKHQNSLVSLAYNHCPNSANVCFIEVLTKPLTSTYCVLFIHSAAKLLGL